MDKETISKANKLHEANLVPELYEFIKPFLEDGDPDAYYFYSQFSLPDWGETDDEYDRRYVDSLIKAAKGNVVEAMYRLSSMYLVGDVVDMDIERGKMYLDQALARNFGPAKLTVGLNLYYGSNGYQKDFDRSFNLVTEAAQENVEGASEALLMIKKDQ
ncbi:sel1 repeat family protein [Teredinibacter turnerae]|uniref:sel1 repeat family protein n=1 Tax=Teredinibacter turnerae TaxID=2426 RepID=UPI0003717579|nr:sel1 repeat family protein [Teredinibacter turnerae]